MVVEGAAALALAAYFADATAPSDHVSVVLLCGGNYDRNTLLPILSQVG